MNLWIELLLVSLALTNLALTSLCRLETCIRVAAAQGILLGLVTVALHSPAISLHMLVLVLGIIVLKGLVFPWLLFRAMRQARVRREVEPFVSFTWSLLIGTLALPTAMWLSSRLPAAHPSHTPLLIPVALHAILAGLLLIVSRRKAITQVLGYLVMENGIYLFGIALVGEESVLVDLATLLDVFVGVFVMGIAIFHINRTFDHIDTDRLSALKDWPS
ncbi:MAG: hypothetical protein GXY44_00245 [Phycisphaerales bacterium]|nr:hypothetical protein [Phycisphaerales bacterium]